MERTKAKHQQSQQLESDKTNDPNSPMDSIDTESTLTSQKLSEGPKLKKLRTEQSEFSSNATIDQK
uniref:Uncharacterized protein n=1 Tax=Romanomermis culicivorax TaxID=13658 RepID=A0A915IYY9_ROMCU